MLRIIVERGSLDGNLKIDEFECHRFYAQNNVRIKDGPEQDVIICNVKKSQMKVIGYFGSVSQRNAAIELLKKRSSDIVILGYNEYFCYEAFDDIDAIGLMRREFKNFNLQKHMSLQFERKLTEEPFSLDAFKDLGVLFIEAMKESRCFYIGDVDKYSCLWAKCLWTPNLVITRGISPRQYYKYLIIKNNEKFNN